MGAVAALCIFGQNLDHLTGKGDALGLSLVRWRHVERRTSNGSVDRFGFVKFGIATVPAHSGMLAVDLLQWDEWQS